MSHPINCPRCGAPRSDATRPVDLTKCSGTPTLMWLASVRAVGDWLQMNRGIFEGPDLREVAQRIRSDAWTADDEEEG
jgi:hypothetical protein